GISIRPNEAFKKIFTRVDGPSFLRANFSLGRVTFDAEAVQDDSQVSDTIIVDDPCHNCKGLLRLFGNAGNGNLHEYDSYVRPMRRVKTSAGKGDSRK